MLTNLEFKTQFDNFTCVTYVSYNDSVAEQAARIDNRKTVYANSLVTAHSFCVAYAEDTFKE
jgi:hypothetical protein